MTRDCLFEVRSRIKEPSSMAALAVALGLLKDWAPWEWAWWMMQGVIGLAILAAIFTPERK